MTELSPQAQAVLDAYADVVTRKILTGRYAEEAIAAALRTIIKLGREEEFRYAEGVYWLLKEISDDLENHQ